MTDKTLQAKRKHHHVWADYLKRWSLNNRDVFYTTSKGKIVCESIRGVAVEKDFYRVTTINAEDIEIIKGFMGTFSTDAQELHFSLLANILKIQYVKDTYEKSGKKNEELEKHFFALECNMLEDLHTSHGRDCGMAHS